MKSLGINAPLPVVDSIEPTRSGKKMVIDQRIDISRHLDARVGDAPPG